MDIKVFKFGGASVNSAQGIRNLAKIIRGYPDQEILVVVSAMGKTTNKLEQLLGFYMTDDVLPMIETYDSICKYHFDILEKLFPCKDHPVYTEVESHFDRIKGNIRRGHLTPAGKGDYRFEYAQIVCYGELISTTIVHHYLESEKIDSSLFDARDLIRTDSTFMDARIDWEPTQKYIRDFIADLYKPSKKARIAVTQGFIGKDAEGNTTTLGREGSDFTAAIFAYSLGVKELTIWKDVPGVMNADPKWFRNPKKLDTLSYREAIELAYFGASVIHPKTIKPLENANITLMVKSFLDPSLSGTRIENLKEWTISTPIFIRKQQQVLISISPRDFSFIVEENLGEVFNILAEHHMKVNVMQNSAISFSICVDNSHHALPQLLNEFGKKFSVRYNDGVELYTIRHYNPAAIRRISKNRKVLLEQKTRNTVHLVVTQE